MKIFFILFLLIGIFFVGLYGNNKLINKYWLPKDIRLVLISPKFKAGVCLKSKRWGVNPKKVISHKETDVESFYLLQDMDRYEHSQFLKKHEVEKYAKVSNCH